MNFNQDSFSALSIHKGNPFTPVINSSFLKRAILLAALLLSLAVGNVQAQVVVSGPGGQSIVPTPALPHTSAMLDIVNSAKGLLIPRVSLTSTGIASPITTPATSLLVFNTATTGDVTPGYYYWTGLKWERIATASSIPVGQYWKLGGNSDATATNNKLGTMTPFSLNFLVGGQVAGKIEQNATVANTSLGLHASESMTTGTANTAFGNSALQSNTTGTWNTAIGNVALKGNTTGSNNTAVGDETLTANTTGSGNTALGEAALFRNTTGGRNTSVGFGSMQWNTTGADNTAIGTGALFNNKVGASNVAIGKDAMYNNLGVCMSVAIGDSALASITNQGNGNDYSGTRNVAIGYKALAADTKGFYNTATGITTLGQNTTGNGNTGDGGAALSHNISGEYNTASGAAAMVHNISGSGNVAVGVFALGGYFGNVFPAGWVGDQGGGEFMGNTTGSKNTAVGLEALFQSNGDNNVGLGFQSGSAVTTASNVICIGAGLAGANVSNRTYIGNIASTDLTNASAKRVVVQADGLLGVSTGSTLVKTNANTTLSDADIYYFTASATATLPSASVSGRRFVIVARGAAVSTSTSYTSLVGSTLSTIPANTSVELVSDGSNWLQIR